jgi:hypothetical protein
MRTLAILTALSITAACAEPEGEDTADMTPDAVTGELSPETDAAGDGAAPELANVQQAFDEKCESLRARVETATCVADGLGQAFTCEYSFAQDPEGTQREVVLVPEGDAWMIQDEPDFCGAIDRANMQAQRPDPDVDLESTE